MGHVPEKSEDILREVGKWLGRYGESIYKAELVPDFPYELSWGSFTKKGSKLFTHVLEYPVKSKKLSVYGFLTPVLSACRMDTGEAIPCDHFYDPARNEKRVILTLPEQPQNKLDSVFELDLAGELETAALSE